ncbi:hypothetical protein [Glycomyces harbinensis]|uniref:Uncharacterized protein n=1 Tax=Glycomyces harbinensis TaxID=58114 RepID=A0A1G7BT86_9ACTN|nr:hypothetical protein [Glycomyces harbinensis]SDE30213.1 hypothetical protein SAMN05216270_117148 [Glycomyces harbinensis]
MAELHSDDDGWLGDFHRGPAVFSVHRVLDGAYPLAPTQYRIACNDGAGPREICRFLGEADTDPEWFGRWQGDEWCPWILERANRLIDAPERG